ncbi:MAG: polysaccharide pyruvyl transferase family protein [Moorea sp. SIO2I5]|nr:polysaccharide pyruvyl transferase family protein [Moorena sp. SIO2I5]
MKLTYHSGKNFGDALNPLIFNHFMGFNILNESSDVELLGIGTILGLKQSPLPKVVFSSGCSDNEATYGSVPVLDERYDIRCVRGPLTAKALNLPPSTAVTDGAVLVREVLPRCVEAVPGKIGFIPHHKSLDFYPYWSQIAQTCGLNFLDVREEPKSFIQKLWQCEVVITEAMHGAIVADTYGIPWIPIKLYPHINSFKWMDWSLSVGIEIQFLNSPVRLHTSNFFMQLMIKRRLPRLISQTLAPLLLRWRIHRIVRWLKTTSQAEPYLSNRSHLDSLITELQARLETIKCDYMAEPAISNE